ncbi:MAG TPA: CBS domain-containing protein [Polyangiales bacterium]
MPEEAQLPLTVGAFMTPTPHVIGFDQTLAEAARIMGENAVRHLPVLRDDRIVGVLSDRDIAIVESLGATHPDAIRVAEAMTPVPYCVPPDMRLDRVVQSMCTNKYGCAIVIDDATQTVLGVFTVTDALRLLDRLLGEADEPAGNG